MTRIPVLTYPASTRSNPNPLPVTLFEKTKSMNQPNRSSEDQSTEQRTNSRLTTFESTEQQTDPLSTIEPTESRTTERQSVQNPPVVEMSKFQLPKDLKSVSKCIELFDKVSTLNQVKEEAKLQMLFNAVSKSDHLEIFDPFIQVDCVSSYEKLKEAILGVCKIFCEEDLSIIYSPKTPEPLKAYHLVKTKSPSATDLMILDEIKNHLPSMVYLQFKCALKADDEVNPKHSLRKMVIEYIATMKTGVRNVNLMQSSETVLKLMHDQAKKIDELQSKLSTPPPPPPQSNDLNEIKILLTEMANRSNDARQTYSNVHRRNNHNSSNRQFNGRSDRFDPRTQVINGKCYYHNVYRNEANTCRQGCDSFNASIFTQSLPNGNHKKPFQRELSRSSGQQTSSNTNTDSATNSQLTELTSLLKTFFEKK